VKIYRGAWESESLRKMEDFAVFFNFLSFRDEKVWRREGGSNGETCGHVIGGVRRPAPN